MASITVNSLRARRSPPDLDVWRGRRDLPTIAAGISIAVGAVVLLGWLLGIDTLKSIVPGWPTMKVNAAIAFILLGSAIRLRSRGNDLAFVPIVAVIVLSAAVGVEYLLGRDLGVDQWLFRELPGQVGTIDPNRISPMTVICLLLIGTGLLLAAWHRMARVAAVLLMAALTIAFFNILDASFEPTTRTLFTAYTQMALITAIPILVVSAGALTLLPGGGPLVSFAGASASAALARRMLAAAVVVPVALTGLWLMGESAGVYGPRYGASLVVLGTVGLLAVVIHQAARATERSEAIRQRMLEERDRFFDVSIDLLATINADGRFVRLNPAWTETLGYDLAELRASPFLDFVHPDDRLATRAAAARQVELGQTVLEFQNRFRHSDGSYRWLEWTSRPSADGTRLYATARDITGRKQTDERLATLLAPAREAQRRRNAAHRRIEAAIAKASFKPVFQPIVDLATRRTIGFEALTRFDDGRRPDQMFAAAIDCGLGVALESVTLEAALRSADLLPADAWLSLNVSPTLVADLTTLEGILGPRLRPIVLEITEHEAIAEYAPLREAVVRMGPDVRVAVDDAGAGVANFNHLVELRPDFLKIDVGLVRGVDTDVGRQAVVAGLVHFAASAGCQVIAEGIETEAELATVTRLGVTLGQGYLLARPSRAETWRDAVVATVPAISPTTVPATVTRPNRRRRSVLRAADPAKPLRRTGS
ncbi:MAG TPA: EAL domain-containing protein [Candidatus Limnocylindrales bacterium]